MFPDRRHQRRFTWVVPRKVIGMALPDAADLAALRRAGVRRIISLTSRPLEDNLLSPSGIIALHMPLADLTAPTMEQAQAFVDALEKLVSSGEKVAVHCGAGLGRTGTMLACYLVSRGAGAEEAISEVRRHRPGSVESPAQEDAVRLFEARVRRRAQ